MPHGKIKAPKSSKKSDKKLCPWRQHTLVMKYAFSKYWFLWLRGFNVNQTHEYGISYPIYTSPTKQILNQPSLLRRVCGKTWEMKPRRGAGSGPKRFSTGNSWWKFSPNELNWEKIQCGNELSKKESEIIYERLTNVQTNMMCSNVDAVCGKEILAEYSFCAMKGLLTNKKNSTW